MLIIKKSKEGGKPVYLYDKKEVSKNQTNLLVLVPKIGMSEHRRLCQFYEYHQDKVHELAEALITQVSNMKLPDYEVKVDVNAIVEDTLLFLYRTQ